MTRRVWLVHAGEPLPTDPGERLLRMGLVADELVARGHEVVWWSSTFDHTHKRQRHSADAVATVRPGFDIRYLFAPPYHRNISHARLRNHRALAARFAQLAPTAPRPDVVLCTVPTLELAAACADYRQATGVPLILDVRDLHPDIYATLVPGPLRPLARLFLRPLYRDLRRATRAADALVAIAPSFLAWGLAHAGRSRGPRDRVFPLAYPELSVPEGDVARARANLIERGVDPNRRLVWYLGTFNRWIDLEPVISAARAFADGDDARVQFVFSGNGDRESRWRALAAGLPNVVFTGWVDAPGIKALLGMAWAGLAPYREGFHTVGNKLFEYMAGGLPVLLGIGGDAAALLAHHECGLTYRSGSGADLARLLRELVADPTRRDFMAANSRRAYEREYRAERVYGDMAEFVGSFTP